MSESPTPSPLPEIAPLPWYVDESAIEIYDASGKSIVWEMAPRTESDRRYLAEQIMRSVNAHAALVEALRKFTTDGTFTLDDLLHARALLKELDTK